jgi:hypothetical protein
MSDAKAKLTLASVGWWLFAVALFAAATIDAIGIFGITNGPHALVRWLFGLG